MDLLKKLNQEIEQTNPEFWKNLDKTTTSIRQHPIEKMMSGFGPDDNFRTIQKSYGYKLAKSILYVKEKHGEFFQKKMETCTSNGG